MGGIVKMRTKSYPCSLKTLIHAIREGNKQYLEEAMRSVIHVENNSRKKHTLNRAICTMLSNHADRFDLEIIKILMRYGATVSNNDKFNTLSITIEQCFLETLNILYDYKTQQNNVLELIKYLTEHGARPNNSETLKNTLTLAVRTNNLEIIKIILKHGGMPDNSQFDNFKIIDDSYKQTSNTLTHAVLTGNPQIVKIICKHGGMSDNSNKFYMAHCLHKT